MKNVLAMDTSTNTMAVAVLKDGMLSGEIMTHFKKNHSLRLMPAIDQIMNETELKPADLDGVIIGVGPGSYTGVRIGVTTAKMLAWSMDIPVAPVSSLQALAQNGKRFSGGISPLIDARRGQVYAGLYEGGQQSVKTVVPDRIVLLEDWLEQLVEREGSFLFIGEGAVKHQSLIKERMKDKAVIAEGSDHLVRPGEFFALADEQLFISPEKIVPEYAQLAEAEKKWLARQKGSQNEQ